MKPFYHHNLLLEATPQEILDLRTAVANMADMWSDQHEDGTYWFPEEHEKWHKLYMDLTHIAERIPF